MDRIRRRDIWIGMIAVGLVIGLAGPFGSAEAMRLVPRLIYWVAICTVTYLSGVAIGAASEWVCTRLRLPFWPSVILSGLLIGIVVLAEVLAINYLAFGAQKMERTEFFAFAATVIAVAIIVSVASSLLPQGQVETQRSTASAPKILSRIALEKRGRLYSVSATDHYVNVVTHKGEDLILMRLSDAIAETAPTRGLRVHRSHWVALDAVKAVRKDGAKTVITLVNGTNIPVSRTYLPVIKEAGLLAVTGNG